MSLRSTKHCRTLSPSSQLYQDKLRCDAAGGRGAGRRLLVAYKNRGLFFPRAACPPQAGWKRCSTSSYSGAPTDALMESHSIVAECHGSGETELWGLEPPLAWPDLGSNRQGVTPWLQRRRGPIQPQEGQEVRSSHRPRKQKAGHT